ncbi:hypothetical protein E9230_001599 [Corynebacterium glutamicum]|nr:hypothetical protein [Corynebacterium glutamicum]
MSRVVSGVLFEVLGSKRAVGVHFDASKGGCEGGVLAQPNHSAHGTRKCVSWALWFVLSPSIPATDAQVLDLRGSWARLSGAHRSGVSFELAPKNFALSESLLSAVHGCVLTSAHSEN